MEREIDLTEPNRDAELDAAYERVRLAYAEARKVVFSRHPQGVSDRQRLTAREQACLDALDAAEQDLDALRRRDREQHAARGGPSA